MKTNDELTMTRQTWIELAALTLFFTWYMKSRHYASAGSPSFFEAFVFAFASAMLLQLAIGIIGGLFVLGYKNKVVAYNFYKYLVYACVIGVDLWAGSGAAKGVFSSQMIGVVLIGALFPGSFLGLLVAIVGIISFLTRAAEGVVEAIQQEGTDIDRNRYLKELQIKKIEEELKGHSAQPQVKRNVVPPSKKITTKTKQNNNLQQTDSMSGDVATLRKSAFQACEEGDHDRAIGICNKILKSNPEDAKTLSLRGSVYSLTGEYDDAQSDFAKAISIDPDDSDTFEGQAFMCYCQGDLDEAMVNINKAIRINPDDGEYYFLRGRIFFDNENWEKAIIDFNTALKFDIKDEIKCPLYVLRGNAYIRQGENETAKSDFDKAIGINPNNEDAYTSRGVAYMNQDEDDQAQEDFNKAIEVNPENTEALELRSMLYAKTGEVEKAKEDLDKAISLNPENIDELKESRAKL